MHHHYRDILSRIAEPPRWFDENGVPRFDDFDPDTMANIYAQECVLMVIRCQACGVAFEVALDARTARQNLLSPETSGFRALAEIIRSGEVHYGDPPNTGCCAAGPTMNSVPVRVVQYWRRVRLKRLHPKTGKSVTGVPQWERDPGLELDIAPPW